MKAEQMLPDHVNQLNVRGQTVRKGTVAAFLANAQVWTRHGADGTDRDLAAADMNAALPALLAIGFFEIVEIRNPSLREWVHARIAAL